MINVWHLPFPLNEIIIWSTWLEKSVIYCFWTSTTCTPLVLNILVTRHCFIVLDCFLYCSILYLPPPPFLSLSLTLFVSVSLSVSVSLLSNWLYVCAHTSLFLSVCLPLSLCLSLCLCLSISVCLFVSVSVCLSVSLIYTHSQTQVQFISYTDIKVKKVQCLSPSRQQTCCGTKRAATTLSSL